MTENNQRKATDVLVELETKVDNLTSIVSAQDFNIKVLLNKLNDLMLRLASFTAPENQPQRFTAETTKVAPTKQLFQQQIKPLDPERNIPIYADNRLPQIEKPQEDLRRTGRPSVEPQKQMPIQLPKQQAEIRMPEKWAPLFKNTEMPQSVQQEPIPKQQTNVKGNVNGQIPVIQRCVDKNGKSIYLADVKILDLSKGQEVYKTRTNPNGKWQAALDPGSYRVMINKGATQNKPAVEAIQDIQITGNSPTQELSMIIIK